MATGMRTWARWVSPVVRQPARNALLIMANRLSLEARDALHFRVLDVLARHPDYSQRELASALGLSLGRLNYCLRGLVTQGMVRMERFASAPHKRGYWLVLTPAGLAERVSLARSYLARRREEFDALQSELEALQRDWPELGGRSS